MRKLLIVCIFSLLLGSLSNSVFAIQYCKDFLEDGNPGGLGSLKTFDDEVRESYWYEYDMDIWINDVSEPLLQGGFWLTYDTSIIQILDVKVYDGELYPALWDPGFTGKIPEAGGPGTWFISVGNFATVTPDGDGDIIIARVHFTPGWETGYTSITISTVPGFDTVIGSSDYIYDPDIIPNTIPFYFCSACACDCNKLNPENVILTGSQLFTPLFSCCECSPEHNLQWSDTCTQGDIDQTGLFTAYLITMNEQCQVCVTDLANHGIGCCSEVILHPCECEGNYDGDEDQDGSDAAQFKLDFGRSIFLNPCTNILPCNGDFECDSDVDGTDAALFKDDFGRSPFSNPCPICPTDPWCTYP